MTKTPEVEFVQAIREAGNLADAVRVYQTRHKWSDKHTPIEGIVEEFDSFLDKFTGKHEKDNWLKQSLYADTVQVRKDLIVKEFQSILQSQADQYEREKGEMVKTVMAYFYEFNDKEEDFDCNQRVLKLRNAISREMNDKYGVDLSE